MSHLDMRTPVIRAVEAVKAVQRIPEGSAQSFFGKYDIWRYEGIADEKLCEQCLNFLLHGPHGSPYYFGTELRANFPSLEILDANTIGGPEADGDGLVHPNCRCRLHRVTESHEYLAVLEHYA